MKDIRKFGFVLFLILTSVSFGQISKSVFTQAQKDTIKKIAGDSSQVAETRAKNYTDAQFNNNPKGWQTASQVRNIVGDSSNVLRGLINSGAGLDTNAVRNIAKQSALDTLEIVSIYSQEPSGSSAIDKGITVTGLTMHSSVTSIIDPEYGTPLSNYRGSGKNLVQYFVERDFYGNLRTGTWDAGAINGN